MFEMLFEADRVNRMLWTVLRYHGYEPESMECPYYEEEEDEEEEEEEEDCKKKVFGFSSPHCEAERATPPRDPDAGRTTLSEYAETFLEYVYATCMCAHFQVPGAVHGAPRLQDVLAVMTQHAQEAQRCARGRRHCCTSYRFQVLDAGVGAGRSMCGPEEVLRSRWMACWQGLAVCHPRITKVCHFYSHCMVITDGAY
jgi:hypothetical protein